MTSAVGMTKHRNPHADAAWKRKAGAHGKGKRPEPDERDAIVDELSAAVDDLDRASQRYEEALEAFRALDEEE